MRRSDPPNFRALVLQSAIFTRTDKHASCFKVGAWEVRCSSLLQCWSFVKPGVECGKKKKTVDVRFNLLPARVA